MSKEITTRAELDAIVALGPFCECELQCKDYGVRYYGGGKLLIVYQKFSKLVCDDHPEEGFKRVDTTREFDPAEIHWLG